LPHGVLDPHSPGQSYSDVIISVALAPDDLSGIIEPYADFVLKLPLIADESEKNYTYMDKTIMWREPGEPLNARRMGVAEIEALKARIAPHVLPLNTSSAPRPAAQDIARLIVWRATPRRRPSS
jgi:hypothetical protein